METTEVPQHHYWGIINVYPGATINNLYVNSRVVKQANETFQNNSAANKQPTASYSDGQIARALSNIVGKGKAIDSKQKWAGALWLLHWACNYPVNAKLACERVNSLPFERELEYGCDYNNIRPFTTLSFMNEDPRQMDAVRYSKNDESVFLQMRQVVIALQEELQKQTISE